VGRGLVRYDVGDVAALEEVREDLGRVPEDADAQRLALALRLFDTLQGRIQIFGEHVEVAGIDATLCAFRVYLDAQGHAFVHGDG
jgi:hypothetical protein